MRIIRSFAASDRGLVRSENEDSYVLHIPDDAGILHHKGILAVVADGVGGGPAGKQASSMAVEIVKDLYYRLTSEDNLASLRKSLEIANTEIYKAAQQNPRLREMATTCTSFVLRNGKGFMGHAGDSRAYLLRKRELIQISEDHTIVNELVKEGIISPEEGRKHPQRNIILKALGTARHVEPDFQLVDLEENDTLLLCSDGLHGYVSDEEISSVLLSNPIEEAGRQLIGLTFEKGGPDNITVILLNV